MRALTGVALLLSATALALSVVTLLRDDDPPSREVTLGLTEKEDEFKFSDIAPEARSEEDVSAGDSFVFSGDVSGERKGRLAGACAVADKGEPTCHATYTFDDGQITVAGVPDFSQDAETFQLPVTGGSDAYEGASGQVRVRENGQAKHDMTLLLPERE
jgi:Allene oxide cyclase barrel like domain